ncbi:MAG: HAD-IA family hydrolase [Verrucomicrobiae bacterium]|nr:HAD-IA family hydrolase [Verrucomicrobiae bacterium]
MEQQWKFEAVFFDLDGTLIESTLDIAISVNHVRTLLGMEPLPVGQVRRYVGDGVQVLFERALETRDREIIDRAVELWRPHYLEKCLVHTVLFDGVREMLEELAVNGVRMAVITNKPRRPAEIILRGLKVMDYFDVVVGGDCTPTRKPEPESFRLALEKMELSASPRILHVGDSPNDVDGARNLGLSSGAVLWGHGTREDLKGADVVAQTVADLIPLVRGNGEGPAWN